MKKIIIANWKMNPLTLEEARGIFDSVKKTASRLPKVEAVVCPPFPYLSEFRKYSSVKLGAQDLFWEDQGAYTGAVSAPMLKFLGLKYVIIGHSERRKNFGETDEIVNKKLKKALQEKFKAVLCVGEPERSNGFNHLHFLRKELEAGLKNIPKNLFKNLIIAYEPVWAIGRPASEADSPESVMQMSIYIRRVIQNIVGKDLVHNVPIIYGGSVEESNAEDFFEKSGVQGLLVGRASLIPKKFSAILKIAGRAK